MPKNQPCELYDCVNVQNPNGDVVPLNLFLEWSEHQQLYWVTQEDEPTSSYTNPNGSADEVLQARNAEVE